MANKIDQLIINSPYVEPKEHWSYNPNTQAFDRMPSRRSTGYFVAGPISTEYNDLDEFKQIPLVNEIRKRVKIWKNNNYPGVTGITRKLIEHWYAKDIRRFTFFLPA
jgi:type III restriction enzyme